MPTLVVSPGLPEERAIELPEGVSGIGRAAENRVAILHKSLSRAHAELEVQGDRITLRDLGSKNGTFLGDAPVLRPVTLKQGDTFRCGEVEFSLGRVRRPLAVPTLVHTLDSGFAAGTLNQLVQSDRAPVGASALRIGAEAGRRTEDKLRILLRVSELLAAPGEIDPLLERILDLLVQILDVSRACILKYDADTDGLTLRVARGIAPGDMPASTSIARWVCAQGAAGLFADARFDQRLVGAESVVAQSIASAMCAPLRPRDRVIGVLYVDNVNTPHRFGQEDLEFLSAFANQAAIAIENATLVRKIEAEAALKANLSRFFPPSALAQLQSADSVGLGTVDADVTALFSDLSGFTEMSSSMAPRDVVALLNEYFPAMAGCVFREEGTLEKYIGDALLAVWGAPFPQPDSADRAVDCAVAMQRALRELNLRWQPLGRPPLSAHIGLNSGPVAAGNIGSEGYLQYATIGDATNVASRVCTAAGAHEILLSRATADRLQRAHPLEPVGRVSVKGKAEPLELFRVRWE